MAEEEALKEGATIDLHDHSDCCWVPSWLLVTFGIITITALAYEKSSMFRYYFKFALYVIICSSAACYMIPLSLFRPRDVRNVLFGIPLVRLISPLVGIRWEISNKEILAKDFPCVIISNHQSAWDFMAICELWPTMRKCACVAKKAILYVFPFGFSAWLCGTVYINRKDAKDSRTKISSSAEQIQKDKTKMWIFPEGTRSKKSELLPFKKGAFHIAMQNKLPIVPVVISPYTFINDEKKIFNSGRVLVTILPVIETEGRTDVNELTDQCRTLMNDEYQRLSSIVLSEAGKDAVCGVLPVGFENGKRRS